jgi:hypothetical protein
MDLPLDNLIGQVQTSISQSSIARSSEKASSALAGGNGGRGAEVTFRSSAPLLQW